MRVPHRPPEPSFPSVSLPQRNVLVTVSESSDDLYASRFIAHFLHKAPSVDITLLYVAPPKQYECIGPYGLALGQGGMDEAEYQRHVTLGNKNLGKAREVLLNAGIEEERITSRTVPGTVSMGWEIIHQGTYGGHAAVVQGNRGRGWLENMLEGSPDITSEIIKQSCAVPLWLCPPQACTSHNVMICVDGSASAFNAVYHIASLLGPESAHTFTLVRVCRAALCHATDSDMLFLQCRQIMEGQGIAANRISSQVILHDDVVGVLLRLAVEGNFSLIVAGRKGMGGNLLEHLLMGSVAKRMLRRLRSSALCLCC